MRYVRAKCQQEGEQLSWRAYMAECLRLQGEGKYMARRWIDMIEPGQADDRTGDEIALQVIRDAGLVYEG